LNQICFPVSTAYPLRDFGWTIFDITMALDFFFTPDLLTTSITTGAVDA
jgi:hypothetical protein